MLTKRSSVSEWSSSKISRQSTSLVKSSEASSKAMPWFFWLARFLASSHASLAGTVYANGGVSQRRSGQSERSRRCAVSFGRGDSALDDVALCAGVGAFMSGQNRSARRRLDRSKASLCGASVFD